MRCYSHPDYAFPLPEDHPFPMDKFWRSAEIVRMEGGSKIEIIPALPASEASLLRVHTQTYLEQIKTGALDSASVVKLGLPPSDALLYRSRLEVGGTLAATWAALEDGLAGNLAGGTHHAFPSRGLGYCVLNDVAVAIREVNATTPQLRSFVIDTDAHQGNGTNGIFAGDSSVFTYSIHVGKNYPAEKTPGSLDVELPRFASGEHYLEQLETTLPRALETFAPDLIFWIAGADPHQDDRFGQLKLTDAAIQRRDRQVLELVTNRWIPTVILYGGGYNRNRLHTARLHANTMLLAAAFAERRSLKSGDRNSPFPTPYS